MMIKRQKAIIERSKTEYESLKKLSVEEKKDINKRAWEEAALKARKKKIERILGDIEKLKEYGEYLERKTDGKSRIKGNLLVAHAGYLREYLNPQNTGKRPKNFCESFCLDINRENAQIDKYRNKYSELKIAIANILLFFLGGFGVIYLPLKAIHYAQTGRCMFFSQTTSRGLIDNIQDRVKYYNPAYEYESIESKIQKAEARYKADVDHRDNSHIVRP